MIKKITGLIRQVGLLSLFAIAFISTIYAQDYTFYYGDGCPHCANVEDFFNENNIINADKIDMKEVYKNTQNREEFMKECGALGIPIQEQGVPMLLIQSGDERSCLIGDGDIIKHFEDKVQDNTINQTGNSNTGNTIKNLYDETTIKQRRAFFGIMLPAAISDSINPCAFTVMLLLLTSILTKTQNRKKAILAGLLFSFAVFATYLLIGVGLFSALATAKSVGIIKLIFGTLGILVGLANLKDFFWYGKGFVMEVPFSRRPVMKKIIDKATSPLGAFLVGIFVSLFLLPCSSGPYFTILGYLASQSKELHLRGYTYLTVYNLIFILPMIIITILVGFGFKSVKELANLKNNNTKLIHLIVGLLMLGLGIYVLLS